MDSIGKKLLALIVFIVFFSANGIAVEKLHVFVSIIPQKYFVQQIGKDLVNISVMVQPGANPATYEPKPRQMADLSKAAAYFAIGVPFEQAWLKKIAATNPHMQIIHTDHGIEKLSITAHHHDDHETAHNGDHSPHESLDPHIWLSPPLVKIQARIITDTLIKLDPTNQNQYQANLNQFIREIDQIHHRLQQILAPKRGARFFVFHPSWGYFAHTYGLIQVPVEIEGKDPKPARLKELIDQARQNGIKVIFVQPQFSTKSARLIAHEIGGQVVFADPLAEEWPGNLMDAAKKFQTAL